MEDEKAREKARNLRYKKAIVRDINLEAIRQGLEEMSEACSDVRYFIGGADESLLSELVGSEDEAFELRMMFSGLDADCNRMYEDLENEWIPDCFDDFFVAVGAGAGASGGGLYGFDDFEGDYFGLCSGYESQIAEEEAAKRLTRLTKKEIVGSAQVCFNVAASYLGLRSRYDNLKAAIDILRGENAGYLQQIKSIDDAYDKAADVAFRPIEDETREFDRLVSALPGEAWLE